MNPEEPVADTESPKRSLVCLVVEDHTLIAQLLLGLVRSHPGIGTAIATTTVAEALAEVERRAVDLLLLDLKLPDGDGLSVLRAVRGRHPQAACIVLSSAADEFACPTEFAGQVVALIDKTAPLETLRSEVEAVVRRRLGIAGGRAAADPALVLRPRELEVFERIGQGMTTRAIAESLGITMHTVNSHRKAIVSKVGAVGADLVRLATVYNQTRRSAAASSPRDG